MYIVVGAIWLRRQSGEEAANDISKVFCALKKGSEMTMPQRDKKKSLCYLLISELDFCLFNDGDHNISERKLRENFVLQHHNIFSEK